ncbi:MAG: rhodanese-related sulfurtransferase [Alphaproteobacteria bacterium]|nr:rhodanese-related sulfurtransferase [Alphaproteobacteria bacterium]
MTDASLPSSAKHNPAIVVAALYKFIALPEYTRYREPILTACLGAGVTGTLLLAEEGINGTIAGSRKGIDGALAGIKRILNCTDLEHKESHATEIPFYRMKVKLKKEIVTMGVPGIDPTQTVGTYVAPEDWNALISDPDVIVIDTRNEYEVGIGTFQGAIDPKTETFRDFPTWFQSQPDLTPDALAGKKVAMFCTGGIRCEKATAFVKQQGISDVFHLKGGILKYLEKVPAEESLWQGECFVFDQRVSVKQGLELGSYQVCHACRQPVDAGDMKSWKYVPGVSCPACYDAHDETRKERFRERQRQVELAQAQGRMHIGDQSRVNAQSQIQAHAKADD